MMKLKRRKKKDIKYQEKEEAFSLLFPFVS